MAPQVNRKSALLDSGWQDVQRKTFTKWYVLLISDCQGVMANHVTRINTQLDKGGKPVIKDLKTDLCDGVRLLYLLVPP